VPNAGESFVSRDGMYFFALLRSRAKAAFADLISFKIEELFENTLFTSAIVFTEEVDAEFASNL